MASPAPITPEAISKHVQALLQTPVVLKKLPAQELKAPLVAASIHDESGALVGALIADIAAAGSAGGALSKIPAGAVQDLMRRGKPLDEDLLANYHEVVNVLTVLTTAALGRRTLLRALTQTHDPLEPALEALISDASSKLFLSIAIQGYPVGGMNLYLRR